MPTPTRDLVITYAGLALGGTSSNYFLDAPIRFNINQSRASVEADVVVFGTSESDFKTRCATLETAFKTPRQKLEVKFGAAVHETFDSTDGTNTGFNQAPSCVKIGSVDDTGRSRRYHIAVAVDLPADLYQNGAGTLTNARRSATVNLYTTDAGRRRCTITGTYTASATSGLGARAQYNANITTYVTAITTALTGTWESVFDPQVATDDMDKVCNFSIVLEELIWNQSVGALDDPTLRRQKMAVTRSMDFGGDAVINGVMAQRLQRTTIDYSVAVDKSVTQDLTNTWDTLIKPWLANMAVRVSTGNGGFIESEVPSFDYVENRISARITFISYPSGTLLSARVTTDESASPGISLVPVWGKDRLKKRKFVGPGTLTRAVTVVVTEVGKPMDQSVVNPGGVFDAVLGGRAIPGGADNDDLVAAQAGLSSGIGLSNFGGLDDPTKSPDGGGLHRISLGAAHSTSPRRIGPINGIPLDVVDRVIVARYEYYVPATSDN